MAQIVRVYPMLDRFLKDERGAMVAEYALLMVLACGCLAVLALKLGDRISAAIHHATALISAKAGLVQIGM